MSVKLVRTAAGAWQLIVNGQTAQWASDHKPHPQSGYADLSGVLRVRWGTTELSAPWAVKQ